MSRLIAKSTDDYGSQVWNGVAKVASKSPDWIKHSVEKAAERAAREIVEAHKAEGDK